MDNAQDIGLASACFDMALDYCEKTVQLKAALRAYEDAEAMVSFIPAYRGVVRRPLHGGTAGGPVGPSRVLRPSVRALTEGDRIPTHVKAYKRAERSKHTPYEGDPFVNLFAVAKIEGDQLLKQFSEWKKAVDAAGLHCGIPASRWGAEDIEIVDAVAHDKERTQDQVYAAAALINGFISPPPNSSEEEGEQ